MSDDKVTFNIIGSCVSRSLFNCPFGRELKVNGYLQRNFLLDLFDPLPAEYRITMEEVERFDPHKFNTRNIFHLVNGDGKDMILERKGEWLVIDSFYAGTECSQLVFPDGHTKLIQTDFVHVLKKVFQKNPRYEKFKYRSMKTKEDFKVHMQDAVDYIKENWGDKVILIDVHRTDDYISYKGTLKNFGSSYKSSNDHATRFANMIEKELDCFRIDLPEPLIGDEYNDYRASPVHYITEVAEYLKECVDVIVGDDDRNWKEQHLKDLYDGYSNLFTSIKEHRRHSWGNALNRIRTLMKEPEGHLDALELCSTLVKEGCKEAKIPMSMIFLKGYAVNRSRDIFERLLKDSPDRGEVYNVLEPLLVSTNPGTPERISEFVRKYPKDIDRDLCGKLGKKFLLGNGVPKDVAVASRLLRRAVDTGSKGFIQPLLQSLWEENTEESILFFIEYGEPQAHSGDRRAAERLISVYSGKKNHPYVKEKMDYWCGYTMKREH